MAEAAQFVQGDTAASPGGPQPLPEGEAQQLDQASAGLPNQQTEPNVPAQSGPVQTVAPQQHAPPTTEDEHMMFGPTLFPNEHPTTGANYNQQGKPVPPPDAHVWFPALIQAAQAPGATPELQNLAAIVTHFLSNG